MENKANLFAENGKKIKTDLGRIFCDLVMKGGITSGIVYPRAIAQLAEKFQFRNIGGASAGAIAAAGAAAAEYRRQKEKEAAKGSAPDFEKEQAGFRRLDGLHDELGGTPFDDKRTLLFSLFAPSKLSRPLFGILTTALNRKTSLGRITSIVWGLVTNFYVSAVLGASIAIAAIYAAWQHLCSINWSHAWLNATVLRQFCCDFSAMKQNAALWIGR